VSGIAPGWQRDATVPETWGRYVRFDGLAIEGLWPWLFPDDAAVGRALARWDVILPPRGVAP
jgi:hypothetical protein